MDKYKSGFFKTQNKNNIFSEYSERTNCESAMISNVPILHQKSAAKMRLAL